MIESNFETQLNHTDIRIEIMASEITELIEKKYTADADFSKVHEF